MSLPRALGTIFLLASSLPSWAQTTTPHSLRADIKIERFASVMPRAVRLARDPIAGTLQYITFAGDLYELRPEESGALEGIKMASATDHGITRLQGMAFHDSSLYLLGNVAVNEGKGTRGRLVRGQWNASGTRSWTPMFMTDEIGSVKSAFDHGFNGIAVSADGQFLYINSGARTDHGEVQDNDGAYPGSRDEPLTSAVFRIPTSVEDLLLPNDLKELTERGFLYARGIRNGFDLAFSPRGHLFIVSNSGDYDHPEDMFWLRDGHHYGFPWMMGGVENPQQYPDFEPNPEKYPFLNPYSHAYSRAYFHNDPEFPRKPADLMITPSVANIGPDANYYRDPSSGTVKNGSLEGVAVGTFTAHRSLLGLTFDVDSVLAPGLQGDGFVLGWTNGQRSALMGRMEPNGGGDLLHLKLFYSPSLDNYIVQTTRIVEGFNGATDAVLEGNVMYVVEYGGKEASLWKLTLPSADETAASGNIQPHQHISTTSDG